MGKKKSALFLALMTILIAALCFICTVSFSSGIKYFNSVVSLTQKDANFGNSLIDGESYTGGAYTATYYPEGVISAKEYEDNLGGYANEKDKQEYAAGYISHANGAIYLEKEVVCDKDGKVSDDFTKNFASTVELVRARLDKMHVNGARIDVVDDFSLRITLPTAMESQSYVLSFLTYTGEFTVLYGTSEDTATQILPARNDKTIDEYVKGARSRTRQGNSYVVVEFTSEGRDVLKSTTDGVDENGSNYLYFKIGDSTIVSLPISSQLTEKTLYISSSSYTTSMARAVSIAMDSALRASADDISITGEDLFFNRAAYGDNALMLLYIAFGAYFVVMAVLFFVRYHGLAFAHLYSFLLFLFPMLLCIWAIDFLYIGVETALALMLAGVLLSASNAAVYEAARKEYAQGKTLAYSVKAAYKKCFWHIFDIHIAVALFSFVTFAVALTSLSAFAFVLGLATVFSGVCSLLVGRFTWAIMSACTKNAGAFAGFKRNLEDTDEIDE